MNDSKPARQVLLLAAAALLSLGATEAQAECLSPSATPGDKATTIYRCPDQPGATKGPLQPTALPDRTTVVERGSAETPWFAPKPPENSDETAKPGESATVQAEPVKEPEETTAPAASSAAQVEPSKGPDGQAVPAAEPAEPAEVAAEPLKEAPAQTANVEENTEAKPEKKVSARKKKAVRKKFVKLKPAQTNSTKALAAKATPDRKATKAKPASSAESAAPKGTDSNTVIWTRQDVSLGRRLGNWLGL